MEKAKTTSFNLIILDESGSMSGVTSQTIAGCNETLNTIRSIEKKFGDTQRNLVSIYAFQSDSEVPSRYLIKNAPIDSVKNLTPKDYRPWGCTPLLDAVGSTLIDLEAVASTHQDARATVTIITDGMENSSTEYNWKQVASIISRLKELGWTFNFIGANIDVEEVASRINIDNHMAFESSVNGTKAMFDKFSQANMAYEEDRIQAECSARCMSDEDRRAMRVKMSKGFFKKGR